MKRGAARDPLVVGLQNAQAGMCTNFSYSCSEWLPAPTGLFATHKFSVRNACAIGTSEGPIVVANKTTQNIAPVCLLCGHQCRVTDLTVGVFENTLLSADCAGNVGGWDLRDGTCLFFYQKVAPSGEVRLCGGQDRPAQVFCWALSVGVNVVDLTTGLVKMRVRIVGLRCLGVAMRGEEVLMIAVNLARIKRWRLLENYKLEDIGALNVDDGCCYEVCELGVVRYKHRSFEIVEPWTGAVETEVEIREIGDDDAISIVRMKNGQELLFGSYSGVFKVYVCQRSPLVIIPVYSVRVPHCFLRESFGYCPDVGVVAVVSTKSVVCASSNGNSVALTMPQTARPCDIPDLSESRVLQVTSDEDFDMYDWINPDVPRVHFTLKRESPNVRTSFSVDFRTFSSRGRGDLLAEGEQREHVKICSIGSTTVIEPKYKLQIFVGLSNGNVCFFWDTGGGPCIQTHVMNVPIIAIVPVPDCYFGRPYLVAIGENGACVLMNWNKVVTCFLTNGFPIMSINYKSDEGLIGIETMDGAFSYYSFRQPSPVSVLTRPASSLTIWRRSWSVCGKGTFANNLIRIQNSCSYFGVCDIMRVRKERESPESNTTRLFMREILRSVNRRRIIERQTEYFSLVPLGANNTATLFFPFYQITGPSVLEASPYTATLYFLACRCVARMVLDEDVRVFLRAAYSRIGTFLPVLIQLLNVDDLELKALIVSECVKALSFIKQQDFVGLASNVSEPDEFLLSILFVIDSSRVESSCHEKLIVFLLEAARRTDATRYLALVLLLHGFESWCNIGSRDRVGLFTFILESFFEQSVTKEMEDVLVSRAGQSVNIFFEAIAKIASDSRFDKARISKLCSRVSLENENVGSDGTYLMALLAETSAQMAKFLSDELSDHSQRLHNVAKQNKFLLIGKNDGCLAIFKNAKRVYIGKLFEHKIDIVSLGPKEKWAVAVCFAEKEMKQFCIAGMFKTKLKHITVTAIEPTSDFEITWTSEEECACQQTP